MARIQRSITAYFLSFTLLVSGFWQVKLSHPTIVSSPIQTAIPLETPVPVSFTNQSYDIIGQIGGPTQAVAVAGDFVYLGVGSRMMVLDISNPASPYERSSTQPFGSPVESIEVSDTTAYISAGIAGLYIIDISNPDQPIMVGNYDSPGYTEGVSVVGHYAYVADGPAGLRVIDITDPTHPVEVSTVYKMNYAFNVVIAAGYAYIAGAGAGLLIAGVTNPLQPEEIGTLNTPGYAFSVALSGDTAYVADGWGGLRVVNVSNRAQPQEIGTVVTEGWVFDVVIASTTAYVADAFSGVQILNVSTPSQPTILGSYDMGGDHVGKLALNSGNIYVTSRNKGLSVLEVVDPGMPQLVSTYNPIGFAADVAVSGSYAYVAAGSYGLRIVEIADPSHPQEVGAYDTNAYAVGVLVSGAYAYVITGSYGDSFPAGMHVVDITDPAHPRQVAFYIGKNTPRDFVMNNGILYVANEEGIETIDISVPASPVRLGTIDFSQGDPGLLTHATTGIAVSGNYAYVTHADFGLEVVDVSDPGNLMWVGNFKSATVNKLQAVTVGGNFAYASDASVIHILDISDPFNLVEVESYNVPTFAATLVYADNALYLADGPAGLMALDVSDPTNPTLLGWQRLPGDAIALTIATGGIFVADGEGGLYILEEPATPGQVSLASFDEEGVPAEEMDMNPSMPFQAGNPPSFPPVQPVRIMTHEPMKTQAGDTQIGLFLPVIYKNRSNRILMVTSTADSGPGTLREALEIANLSSRGATILFDPQIFPPLNPATIYPSSGLPALASGHVTIDASNAGVILDGSKAPDVSGLEIPTNYNVVKGLQIINFRGAGVSITGAYNVFGGDRNLGNGPMGEGNLTSGNGSGVKLAYEQSVGNRVIGNLIGTDLTGNNVIGNVVYGVEIASGAAQNIIGGLSEADRNVVSGGARSEISLMERANGNKIIGNFVATNATGQVRLGTAVMGVSIEIGGFNNVIQGNVIGNSVVIGDWGSWGNSVVGNFVGVDHTGTISIGGGGVNVVSFNRIGGTEPEERNIISGNDGAGIALAGWSAFVLGNYIGTDVTGTQALGNQGHGITSYAGIQHTYIGGLSSGEGNLISGNNNSGIKLVGFGFDNNFICGNLLGTDASGLNALPNHEFGIQMGDGDHNFVQSNLIANNQNIGLHLMSGVDNRIHHNSFINNGANDGGIENQWDDGNQGNYWGDYEGIDANGDGIGDTPYTIPSNGVDNYPLMEPFYFTRR